MALVNTTKGLMNESELEKKVGTIDNENETIDWVEYYHEGEMVHRSAHMILKKFSVTGESVVSQM